MPQMAPILWLTFFSFMLLLLTSITSSMYFQSLESSSQLSIKSKQLNLLMWSW
uniref:ATP synthase F0 subunit 8 n=1 Tax=Pseudocrangonyx joolaei TaxID=2558326 RepID=A0A7L7TAR9_9CRUS|nr:ATP synthase F0 subunit 8 [Pseudocrangonyx joolaei]QOC70573.1 ATP synthase F0 subunit 8 [Pseudocrangonyx joolaei]